jgi:hypothetical protein
MRVLSACESHGDVEPMVGLAVQLRALGAEMPVCAPPDFAELLAGVGVPLVPVGQPVRPLVRRRRRRRRRTYPGARPSWSPRSSTRSPRRPRDVMRWWRPASCRPECGYDRACGGDRRRRSDRADVGGRAGVGEGRRCHCRATCQDLTGLRAGGLHSRTIEVLDQRGIADRFLSQGTVAQVAGFAWIPLDISDFPTRHNYGLGLWQNHIEHTLAGWVGELEGPIYRGREVTGFTQDDTGVDVEISDGQSLRA